MKEYPRTDWKLRKHILTILQSFSSVAKTINLNLYLLAAITVLVESQEWMEMKQATDADGQLTEESWLVFCIFDREPLILCSVAASLLCLGSLVSWSLALVHQED